MRRAIPVLTTLLAACLHSEPPEPAAVAPEVAWDASPSARSWYLRGLAAQQRADFEEAARSFRWVTRLDRDGPEGWVGLAASALELGDSAAALSAAEEALALGSRDGRAYLVAAQAATALGLPEADERWEDALQEGGPEVWVAWTQRQPSAEPALRRWVAEQRDGGPARRLLADTHALPEVAVLDGLLAAEREGASVVPFLRDAVEHCRVGSVVAWGLDRRVARWSNAEVGVWWGRLQELAGPTPKGVCVERAREALAIEGCVPQVEWWWAMEAAPGWVQRQPRRACTD